MMKNITKRSGALFMVFVLVLPLSFILAVNGGNGDSIDPLPTRSTVISQEHSFTRYAIITTTDLASSYEPLREWRSMTGNRASIFLLDGKDGILSTYNGADDAESLFNFISDLYGVTGGQLRYILLGGDDDKVPVRYLHANASRWAYDDEYLSDVYFSSPETEWDMDGDGKYGEREDLEQFGIENLTFPLVVGRFPVSDNIEAGRMVQRVLNYERNPPGGDWTSKGIMSSSLMERPNVLNDPDTPEDEGFDAYKDNAYKAIMNYTLRYFPMAIELQHYHDYSEYFGGSYSRENDTLGIHDLPDAISNGSAFFTFAGQSFYDTEYGHSPPIAHSLAQYIDPAGIKSGGEAFAPALTYEDSWNLTNGDKLPVAYISSCDSLNFSSPGDVSLENMVYAPEGGAICLIGSTGVSWRGEGVDYSLGNWYLLSKFWQKMVGSNMPGDSLYWLKQNYIETKWDEYATKEVFLIQLYTYNYLGDPALRSWMGSPRNLTVSYLPDNNLYAGGDTFTARVMDGSGNPVANTIVSLYLNTTGQVFSSSTGPDGMVEIDINFENGGDAKITVTGMNYLPFEDNISVLQEPTDLSVDPGSLSISPLPLTEKTDATLMVNVSNIGGRDADNVHVKVTTGEISDDIGSWTGTIAERTLSLERGATRTLMFTISPMRSWSSIIVGMISDQVERNLDNNIASLKVDINGAPRFLPHGFIEMEEDQKGGKDFDLAQFVYDPDDDVESLTFSLGSGAPSWVSLAGNKIRLRPPANWSGSFEINVGVSDGLASDMTTFGIFVSPVNDPPALIGLSANYTAVVNEPFTLLLQPVDAEGDRIEIRLNTSLERLKAVGHILRMVPYSEDIGVYLVEVILDDGSGGTMKYTFSLEVIPSTGNLYFQEPAIKLPPAWVKSEYHYRIEVGGDISANATFHDDSDIFDIALETGEISFTPSDDDIGKHWVTITATSGDKTISRPFLLEVKEREEDDPLMIWILGIIAIVILLALMGVIFWSGPAVEQYGLEE